MRSGRHTYRAEGAQAVPVPGQRGEIRTPETARAQSGPVMRAGMCRWLGSGADAVSGTPTAEVVGALNGQGTVTGR